MSEDLYIRNWIHSSIARNTAEAVSKNVNQSDYQSSVDFLLHTPMSFRTSYKLRSGKFHLKKEMTFGINSKFRMKI